MEVKELRNLVAFWLLGLCADFGYIVMLSSAEDIIDEYDPQNSTALGYCEATLTSRHCSSLSTGAVLLADIIPILILKITIPFYMEKIPIDVRHAAVVFLGFIALFVVSFAGNITTALSGVVLASLSCGLGEVSYISFTSFFSSSVISAWSSGTGGASIFASLSYAGLTEPHFANLTPKIAVLIMLCIPVVLVITYSVILNLPEGIYRIKVYDPRTWIVPQWYRDGEIEKKKKPNSKQQSFDDYFDSASKVVNCKSIKIVPLQENFNPQKQLTLVEKLCHTVPLLKLMVPLTTVYFAEYLINQGLVQLIIFDCPHSFDLSQTSQYRWYQVIYQAGVFISRSTASLYKMPYWMLFALPVLQLCNAVFFFVNAMYFFVPHIGILFALILLEGLIGGSSYVNTYKTIYANSEADVREFNLAFASLADTFGIVFAGFLAIPLHNFICDRPLP